MYILKFILLWLLPPGCIVILLALLAAYLFKHRSRGRYALVLITVLLYLASLMPFAQFLTNGLEGRYPQPADAKPDVIAVLGGGAVSDVPDIDGAGALSAAGMNRLMTGLRLQRRLNVPVIVSGGKVFADSGVEAEISRRVLVGAGIPDELIYTDSKALNTKQNAQNIAKLCRQHGWHKILVVTSALHMPRAMQNFSFAGRDLQITAYPCDYLTSGRIILSPFSFAPQAYALDLTAMALKEYLALIAGRFL